MKQTIRRLLRRLKRPKPTIIPRRPYTFQEMRAALEEAGVDLVEIEDDDDPGREADWAEIIYGPER